MQTKKSGVAPIVRIGAAFAVVVLGVITILASANRPWPFALTVAWTGPARNDRFHGQSGWARK